MLFGECLPLRASTQRQIVFTLGALFRWRSSQHPLRSADAIAGCEDAVQSSADT
jgi:hypothetical protein